MRALSFVPLVFATACFAAPSPSPRAQNCIPNQAVYIPQFQNVLVAPTAPLQFVTVGFGNQNYTCSSSGTYTSTGATVQVFDISAMFPGFDFYAIQNALYIGWMRYDGDDPFDPNLIQQITGDYGIPPIGTHFFINDNSNDGGIQPVWDFRTTLGPNAVVVANVIQDLPSPNGPPNVDWLHLNAISGNLASDILRIYSVGGDPPPACSPGTPDITVKFTTQYALYGGSVGSCSGTCN